MAREQDGCQLRVLDQLENNVALVAQDEHSVSGFALLNRSGQVGLLYVAPTARLRGVSKALLVALEKAALELGMHELRLVSTSTALRFYKRCGYVVAGAPEQGFGRGLSHPLKKQIGG